MIQYNNESADQQITNIQTLVMGKIKVTQVKSLIDRSKKQKDTMKALGLKKINQSVVHEESPQLLGMVAKVNHLVKVEEA